MKRIILAAISLLPTALFAANPAFKDLSWTNVASGVIKTRTNNMAIYSPGEVGTGAQPNNDGSTVKMLWVPSKAAFRAGSVDSASTNWDYSTLGISSASFGQDGISVGENSFSLGQFCEAWSLNSFAGGQFCISTNTASIAYGNNVRVRGSSSAGFGQNTIAAGTASFGCGADGVASGAFSFVANDANTASGASASAFGFTSIASGENSFAAGNSARATADNTVALGTALTNAIATTVKLGSNHATVHIAGGLTSVNNMDLAATGITSATNGFGSYATSATNQIAASGWTNTFARNYTVYVTATAVSFTLKDRSGTVLYTSPTLTATVPVNLQPGWAVNAASGLAGTAVPF